MIPLKFAKIFPKEFREKFFKFVADGEKIEINGFSFQGFKLANNNTLRQEIENLKLSFVGEREYRVVEIIACNLKEILIGDFETLKSIEKEIRSYIPLSKELSDKLKNIFDYKRLMNRLIGRQRKRNDIAKKFGHALLELTQVKVCPYCNREFLNAIVSSEESSENLSYRSPFDHFYPQSKYPMFSLSLANLIPCCTTCNSLKRERDPNERKLRSVYDLENDDVITFDYRSNEFDFTDLETAESSIEEIEIKSSEEDIGNVSLFLLKERYQLHKAEVAELLVKCKYLNEGKFKMDKELLGEEVENIYRLLFCNYSRKEDFLRRPLAKLTYDILSRIGCRQIKELFSQ